MSEKGILIVLSGPSGAGKSTVVGHVMEKRNDSRYSISVTTRKPRPGEIDGKEYFFVDLEEFDRMVASDELLEHAEYCANNYGTPRKFVEECLDAGINVVLDIEVCGASQIVKKVPDAVTVFVIPPSMDELRRRLEDRGTETQRAIEARLIRAQQELDEAVFYKYLVINDNVYNAAKELDAIITAERCRFENRITAIKDINN